MIPGDTEERKREAFRRFEDGRYQESLTLCNQILETAKDPALEVLAATNLFYTGRYEDAEVFFRDLTVRMPDSSYVHSYLAKVLEAQGDEDATSEYAEAVRLDPANLDALRSYAGYLLSRNDYRGALPVLLRITGQGKKPGDTRNLMRALIGSGSPDEALAVYRLHGCDADCAREYTRALLQAGDFPAAAESALSAWETNGDPAAFRMYLEARCRYDLPGALEAYDAFLKDHADSSILFDYVHVLYSAGRTADALKAVATLLSICPENPEFHLTECDLLATAGNNAEALPRYERLVGDELAAKTDMGMLGRIIAGYRRFLTKTLSVEEAEHHLLNTISRDVNVVSMLEMARFYEEIGSMSDARAWYYRAYRADFLAGGPDYALFLAGQGEDRECEKVMLYILSNLRRGSDLVRVASIIVEGSGRMHTMKRLMDQLMKKLEAQGTSLSTEGRELLAATFFLSASRAFEASGHHECKYLCLRGMDVIPAHTRTIRIEDFLGLLRRCKEQALADDPVLTEQRPEEKPASATTDETVFDMLGLTDQEQKIVSFLRIHRTASEMELRTLLGTRRVTGAVNRLVTKAATQGISLIAKKGMGEGGEIYEYIGS